MFPGNYKSELEDEIFWAESPKKFVKFNDLSSFNESIGGFYKNKKSNFSDFYFSHAYLVSNEVTISELYFFLIC